MHPFSAGRTNKIDPVSSNLHLISSEVTKEKSKCPTPRSSAFNIDAVLAPFSKACPSKPFKFISFDSVATSPKHRRQPSVIIKNVSQVYNFTVDRSSSSESLSDEEIISDFTHHPKNSIFASTADPKSSAYNSIAKKSCSDEEVSRNEFTDYAENSEGITKPDENYTNLYFSTQEESRETPLGILPKRLYCEKCKMDTTTVVSLKMPTLSFWKVMCCMGSIGDTCSDLESLERYQEFQHKCRSCKAIIASAQPF